MKDSYSFDRDDEGLEARYQLHIEAYDRIFDRCGLRWYRVESDVGMMGGAGATSTWRLRRGRERGRLLAGGYAANVEVAGADAEPGELPPALDAPEAVDDARTSKTIEEVVRAARACRRRASSRRSWSWARDGGLRLVLVRGDHSSASSSCARRSAPTSALRQPRSSRPVGSSPASSGRSAPLPRARRRCARGAYVAGANRAGLPPQRRHLEPGRDFQFDGPTCARRGRRHRARRRRRLEGARDRGRQHLPARPRYSVPMGATYLDEDGKERPIVMGSYGIGLARIAAAAVEQHPDEHGHLWPASIAPVPRAPGRARHARRAQELGPPTELYDELARRGRRGALRRPRHEPRQQVQGRGAARLPAARGGRQAPLGWTGSRFRCGADRSRATFRSWTPPAH